MMDVTTDAFLGGRLSIRQPRSGYRAGADPVFLAASVHIEPKDCVLELGCGVGVAMLCLLAREPTAKVTGVDLQPELLRLAAQNLELNHMSARLVQADIANLPAGLRDRSFDHVMLNPPFFDRSSGSQAKVASRETGRGQTHELSTWLDTALRRLKPRGSINLLHRIESLPVCLSALENRAGDIRVLPLQSRKAQPPKLFILRARKESRGAFKLLPALVLHCGDQHENDGDSYTNEAQNILRNGCSVGLSY